MNHTKNYHLPQWSEDDLILMEDFNQMSRDIEAGIDGARGEAAEAQAAANSAKVTANAANAAARQLPYVVGSYVGTDEDMDIDLGFRPQFVIICGHIAGDAFDPESRIISAFSATGGNVITSRIAITGTGFRACAQGNGMYYPNFVERGRRYDYIAFK